MQIQTRIIDETDSIYEEAINLRYELFFKEFDLPKSIVIDDLENRSEHFVLEKSGQFIGYGRLTNIKPGIYKFSQIVVKPTYQRKGLGTQLLEHMVSHTRESGAQQIELNSQVAAKRIYQKLGFTEQGAIYPSKSTGLPHVKMVLKLAT